MPSPKIDTKSISLTNIQLSGISNGISSSVISVRAFCFFNFPSSMSFFFSFWITLYSSSPVPSSFLCSTSFPWTASCKIEFFNCCGVILFYLPIVFLSLLGVGQFLHLSLLFLLDILESSHVEPI